MSEDLRLEILRRLAFRHWSRKGVLSTKEIADEPNIGRDYVNDECEKMEVLGWVAVTKAFRRNYTARITPLGLLALEELQGEESRGE